MSGDTGSRFDAIEQELHAEGLELAGVFFSGQPRQPTHFRLRCRQCGAEWKRRLEDVALDGGRGPHRCA